MRQERRGIDDKGDRSMNKVILMGRLTRDPEIRYSQGEQSTAVARYTLAVDRRFTRNNGGDQQTADFISCVAFGRSADFAQRNKDRSYRTDSDRKLYKPGWTEGVHDRCNYR